MVWSDRPLDLIRSGSNSIRRSPVFTLSPSFTCLVKPAPSRETVSTPMWIRTLMPSSDVKVTAWPVGKIDATSPSNGA